MLLQLGEVVEGIGLAELAGVDEAHEDVPDVGAVERLVEQGVLPVEDRSFRGCVMMHSLDKSFIHRDLADLGGRLAGGYRSS